MLANPSCDIFRCAACGNVELEADSYQKGNVLVCPHCYVRGIPKAVMSLDQPVGGKITATVDAWHSGKCEADAYCEDHGWKVTHSISNEAAKALEAELETITPKGIGADLWNLFGKPTHN